jgi:site-specific DNA-methyltransferase (adenine-specific)
MFHQMPAAMVPIMAARKLYKYDLVWSKNLSTGFLDVNRRPLRSHEMVLVFSQGRPKYNRTDWPREAWNRAEGRSLRAKGTGTPLYSKANRECRTYTYGPTICAKSVLPFKRPGNFNARADGLSHTTKKPVPMMEWLVKSYSPEGGIVLDSWMGSGSTGVGCLNTGRAFIGIDAARLKHARRAARSAVPA